MTVSDAAIEAAARAMYAGDDPGRYTPFGVLAPATQQRYRDQARAALSAAVPLLTADTVQAVVAERDEAVAVLSRMAGADDGTEFAKGWNAALLAAARTIPADAIARTPADGGDRG